MRDKKVFVQKQRVNILYEQIVQFRHQSYKQCRLLRKVQKGNSVQNRTMRKNKQFKPLSFYFTTKNLKQKRYNFLIPGHELSNPLSGEENNFHCGMSKLGFYEEALRHKQHRSKIMGPLNMSHVHLVVMLLRSNERVFIKWSLYSKVCNPETAI